MTGMGNLERWHGFVAGGDPALLGALLHEDAVFHSPVVHTPQRGKAVCVAYLSAADEVLGGESFRYVREFDCGDRAVLEFIAEIDGIRINGIDMIEWDADGLITDFKVMIRPLKAIQAVHHKMAALLERMAKRAGG